MRRATILYLKRHPLAAVLVMALAFVTLTASSVNLLMLLHANLDFIWRSGWWALREGALLQLLGLLLSAIIALLSYLVFKTCEKLLVEKITDISVPPAAAVPEKPAKDATHGQRP
ncbi:hypothetical protein SAMN02745857_00397 [Andreprevotia lacus DSM 23236]|jgi:uncharacterized BrkB/YihY/UPF0761 family membrane protein|uniref:Uncharacterized protein n=1 Tax=Andreprevotia lacus DSM 23236 TaxID=1121001 RepID=A0A1W1X1Z5_9NEIS|nr:hypothetical protein [Andreprevotia lacus]SMC17758.1 hypothetical protein SAMN02745857_00397 [Andreprevotia lacus DSM 23236]